MGLSWRWAVAACALLPGGANPPSAVGCWVQFEDASKSFALTWHFGDNDPLWAEPKRTKSARWNEPEQGGRLIFPG